MATDFSETAETALCYAVQLARQFDGELHILHVCEDPMQLAGWPVLASGPRLSRSVSLLVVFQIYRPSAFD